MARSRIDSSMKNSGVICTFAFQITNFHSRRRMQTHQSLGMPTKSKLELQRHLTDASSSYSIFMQITQQLLLHLFAWLFLISRFKPPMASEPALQIISSSNRRLSGSCKVSLISSFFLLGI